MENELKLSVSKTKTYDDCKLKFKFCYIEKMPRKDWEHHIFGKFAHKVLQDFHQAYIDGSNEPYNKTMELAFKAAQEEFKDKMSSDMTKECFQLINQYLKNASNNKKNDTIPKVISVEKPFSFQIAPNLILNGVIDRIQIDADNMVHVADYKTTKNKKYLKNDWFQLLTYAYVIMCEDENIQKVRASYILLRHDFEYITTEFDRKKAFEIKEKYLKYAEAIKNENSYEPNPTALCSYCDYIELCPSGLNQSKKFYNKNANGEVNW